MFITSWREAVEAILQAAGASQAQLSRHLKVEPPILNRYLRGKREPDQATIKRINHAVASLVGNPNVAPYLDAMCMPGNVLDDEATDINALVRAVVLTLSRYALLLTAYCRQRLEANMRSRGQAAARRFALELHQAFEAMLLAELRPPSEPVGFIAVCDVLARHLRVKTASLLTPLGEEMIAWDRAMWVVRRELYDANPDAPARDRLAAEQRIYKAFYASFEVYRSPQSVSAQKPNRKSTK